MEEIIQAHCDLGEEDVAWLSWLVEEWDLLADLSFSDLILWVPDVDDNIFWAVAQIRPATGPTSIKDTVVGEELSYDYESLVTEAYLSREIVRTDENRLNAGIPVSSIGVPLLIGERCIGVVEFHANQLGFRAPGALEENYLSAARILLGMLYRHEFPLAGEKITTSYSPRIGDGIIRVDANGIVAFASPNAHSAYRHLGMVADMEGEDFTKVTRWLMSKSHKPLNFSVKEVLDGRIASEVELVAGQVSVRLRIYPLRTESARAGLLIMCRDTTDIRKQEQKVTTKDATIREIHHRVKNSLQMVAALLRLQARRIESPEAKIALDEATKRVLAIATVHTILSQTYSEIVEYDEVAARLFKLIGEAVGEHKVKIVQEGHFGELPADTAERLSLVLTEICQNAVEHGFNFHSGQITVIPSRNDDRLKVEVLNGGEPLADDFDLAKTTSLGLSITKTMVADMDGEFSLTRTKDGLTLATVRVPMD
jgi:two-component sensor histidine kinase